MVITVKKLLPATILVAGVLGWATWANAAPGEASPGGEASWHDGGPGHDQAGHDQEGRHWREGPDGHDDAEYRLLAALGLSDAQREQIKAIHERAHSQSEALESNELANHEKIMGVSPKDPSFASLIKVQKENAAARIQLRADLWTQTYSVLTPAQQSMIPVLVTAAKNERAAREAEWKEHEARWKKDDKGMDHDQDRQDRPAEHP
jgi:Spy/CpxP family protein refolding chaperone